MCVCVASMCACACACDACVRGMCACVFVCMYELTISRFGALNYGDYRSAPLIDVIGFLKTHNQSLCCHRLRCIGEGREGKAN